MIKDYRFLTPLSELGLRSVGLHFHFCSFPYGRKAILWASFLLKARNFPFRREKKTDSGSVFVSFSKFIAVCLIMLVKLRKLDLIASFWVTLYPPFSLAPTQETKTSTQNCVTESVHALNAYSRRALRPEMYNVPCFRQGRRLIFFYGSNGHIPLKELRGRLGFNQNVFISDSSHPSNSQQQLGLARW